MLHLPICGSVLLALVLGGVNAPSALAADRGDAPSLAERIRAEARGKYDDFYEGRNYRPIWLANGRVGPTADKFLSQIANARADGLDPSDYDADELRTMIREARSGNARALADAEVALSRAFVRFVTDMRDPQDVDMTFLDKSVKPRKRSTSAVLRAAAIAPSFSTYVTNMEWMSPHYVRQRTLMTKAMKTGSSEEKLRRISINLERARILPSAWTHHIVVDSASGRLWYYQAGAQKGTMRVVVGKPESPTPMYAGVVQYAVLRPYWNVPVDLTRKLIAPKVLAGKTLTSIGYEALSDWSENAQKLSPSQIDWRAVANGKQELRVRQLPGPRNSMGKVKFMFPNETGIFLHDTPERNLFKQENRHFSNGCVRLEDAATLGKWLMGRPLPSGAAAQPDQVQPLPAPVPIYMTYFTTTETKAGVGFLKDVYRRDNGRS